MSKKFLVLAMVMLTSLTASAQFEEGKVYIGGSLTGLNLKYSGLDELNIGVQSQVGYTFADNLMVLGQVSYEHFGNKDASDCISAGLGGRYYIEQNGIYLGVNCKLVHANHNYNDIMPGIEVGYAFFLSRTVTVEPAIYYDQSFKKHSDYSSIGLKIGMGIYLFTD
ncbi:MAG: outer membrane beta-barrel protein [Prevotella sp.]